MPPSRRMGTCTGWTMEGAAPSAPDEKRRHKVKNTKTGRDNAHPSRKHPANMPVVDVFNRSTIVFLTVCSKDRKPIFAHQDVHDVLLSAWSRARLWLVGRYMIMPDHIHMFCSPAVCSHKTVRAWMKYWKSLASRQWPCPAEHPIWQQDGWDTQLRRGESYSEKWEYVSQNPVRSKLVEVPDAWPYQGVLHILPWHD